MRKVGSKKYTLTYKDFESVLEKPLSELIRKKVNQAKFNYHKLTPEQKDQCIKKIVQILQNPNSIRAGKHRLDQWEKGWGENLEHFQKSKRERDILPYYFGKYPILRFKQQFIEATSDKFEYYTLVIIVDWLFEKYFQNVGSIYEFGCGTGHHLLRLREFNKNANLYGLDWATSSQKLINSIAKKSNDKKLFSKQFDFFNPNLSLKLERDSAIYTVAALEQIGTEYKPFIKYLLQNKPKICVHIEPIAELLNSENNLLDYLSVEYFKKRNYLSGFFGYLRDLEKKGKIKVHQVQRTFVGSLYIEGYSIIVWSST